MTKVATGAGLLLLVLAAVVQDHYLQIEWQLTAAVPAVWSYAATVAGAVGGPLFFLAVGAGCRESSFPRLVPNLLWYAGSAAASLVILWRYGPVYGLTAVRDLPELLRFLLLPPSGLSVAYGLALFPLLAWAVRRLPTPLALGAGAIAGAAAGALGWYLLFFLAGCRLTGTLGARPVDPAAAPIAAALVPVTALSGAFLVKRLSVLDGPAQLVVAVAEPVLLTAAIVAAGVVVVRLRPRRLGRGTLAAALLLGSASCTADPGQPEPEVVLAFGGDVHFEGRVQRLLADGGSAFGPAAPLLSAADLAFVNLETPITRRAEPEPKRYVFRADPAAAEALRAAGIDAVSLANNHSMDHGRAGLADTVTAANAARVGTFGAGRNLSEAFQPWRAEVRGVRIAVFGFSQIDDLAGSWAAGPDRAGIAMAFDTGRAVRAVEAARADSDLVVVMPHWGTEGDSCPSREQQDFARRLAGAGADIVVGAHAHVLQGDGHLGSTFVAYGLGNLLWYSSGLFPPFSARSGILTLTVRGRSVVRSAFAPVLTSDSGRPEVLTGWRADLARQNYSGLRPCADLA